jgi:MFS family permease
LASSTCGALPKCVARCAAPELGRIGKDYNIASRREQQRELGLSRSPDAPGGRALNDSISKAARRHLRRNFLLGVGNGALFTLSDALLEPTLVLSWFASQLTDSNFLIGLVTPICTSGLFLLQLLVSGYLQGQERKLTLYKRVALLRGGSWGLMALTLLLVRDRTSLLITFYFLLTVYSLSASPGVLSFMDIVGKAIPPTRRGSFFGLRNLSGGVLALVGSLIVRYVLDERRGWIFPTNFAILFILSFVAISIGMGMFSLVVEPLEKRGNERVGWRKQLRRAWKLPREDAAYARFLATRLSMVGAEMATPFYIVYAKNRLGIPVSMVGTYLMINTASALLSNILWGRISDRRGNRLMIWLAILVGLPSPLIALLIGAAYSYLPRQDTTFLLFGLVFAFVGAFRMASKIAHTNYLLEIAPAHDRPIYLGFANTALGVTVLATGLSGLIVDLAGYGFLFAVALAFFGLTGIFSLGLIEPRRRTSRV